MARKPIYLSVTFLVAVLHKTQGDCGAYPAVNFARPNNNATTTPVGESVTYTCDTGYEFASVSSITLTIECQAGVPDQWEFNPPACQKVNCPVLPSGGLLSSTDNTYLSTVEISCANPAVYRIPGVPVGQPLVITCQANKQWDFWSAELAADACIEIQCPYPLPNAIGTGNIDRGDTNSFTCDTGYYFYENQDIATLSLACNNLGEWEKDGLTNWTCLPRQCSELISTYGLDNIHLDHNSRIVNSEVKLMCKVGYEFNDTSVEKVVTCFESNQTWSMVPFDCLPKLCPPIFNISHANASTTNHWYPVEVNFTCHDGFVFPDNSRSRLASCGPYGRWAPQTMPHCSDSALNIKSEFSEDEFDSEQSLSIGTIFMSVIGVLLLLIIIIDILTCGPHMETMKNNCGSRMACCRDEIIYEDDESIDGDMNKSTLSIGYGRVTPAASTVDLLEQGGDDPSNMRDDIELVNEENNEHIEINENKSGIPRTRLPSAKASINRAIQSLKKVKLTTGFIRSFVSRKANYGTKELPLGQDNYGKDLEQAPPSPVQSDDEESDGSEYTDATDSEEEQ